MDELICNTHFVKPGYIYFTAEPCVISTVLGSCVAVVLYDRTRKLGGMNHFVYSTMGEEDKPTAFYAEPATVQLIRMFTQSGSNIKNVEAHIFGGAAHPDASKALKNIGSDNSDAAISFLDKYGVNIVGQDLGGNQGRKIVFNIESGEVVIAKVIKIRDEDWYPSRSI